MAKNFLRSAFIFRRDLRLEDNTGLLVALEESEEVIPCFIFDPKQVVEHKYRSTPGLAFLINSLRELNEQLIIKGSKLQVFYGTPEQIVQELAVDAVFVNDDYTPFSKLRDDKVRRACKESKKEFFSFADALLTTPGSVLKADGTPYTVYTPFSKKAKEQAIPKPRKNTYTNYSLLVLKDAVSSEGLLNKLFPKNITEDDLLLRGGRKEGLQLLNNLPQDYQVVRDTPSTSCSQLSTHHKFGTISVRESYYRAVDVYGPFCTFINELYWRDFFTHIAHHYPHVFGGSFRKEYDAIMWDDNKESFHAWCEGRTGFPIVDAGMRELNTTGYMHNRVRMVVASFLTKDLHISWRLGEQYFAQKLLDYDPAVNNGNWQWAASTGCDAQPYFRIFNPWLQQKRFDPECEYVKRWVPELQEYSAKAIHNLEQQQPLGCTYPRPIVVHSVAREKAKDLFKAVK